MCDLDEGPGEAVPGLVEVGLEPLERAQEIGARDDADQLLLAEDRNAPVLRRGDAGLELGQGRVLGRALDATAHDPAHGSVRELVADRLVQVLTAHGADDASVVHDEHAALPVALAEDHRVPNALVRRDRAGGGRHHVARPARLELGPRERCQYLRAGVVEPVPRDRRCGTGVATATKGAREQRGIEPVAPAPDDGEDAPVHLHEHDERTGVCEVDDLVREVRDAVDVLGPAQRRQEHLLSPCVHRLESLHEPVQERALGLGERRVQVLRDQILARAVTQAPAERVDVPLRRRRVRERAGVLVDAERERRRLEHGRLELALGEDADHGRRESAVRGDHRRRRLDPLRKLVVVVVEEHLLHRRIEGDTLELPEPRRLCGLDDDEAADRVELEPARLDHAAELVGVQAVEVPDVPIQRTDRDERGRVEPARGEHRRERVEIGVPVGRDDFLGPHGLILPPRSVKPGRARCGSELREPSRRATPHPLRRHRRTSLRARRSAAPAGCPRAPRERLQETLPLVAL